MAHSQVNPIPRPAMNRCSGCHLAVKTLHAEHLACVDVLLHILSFFLSVFIYLFICPRSAEFLKPLMHLNNARPCVGVKNK